MRQTPQPKRNGYVVSRDLTPTLVQVADLRPLGRETRSHSPAQIRKLANSLEEWGFVLPVVTNPDGGLVAGWALVLAARKIGLTEVPAVTIADLPEPKLRALRLALNRLSEDANWDEAVLRLEFKEILEFDGSFDLSLTGFEMGEVDGLLGADDTSEDDEADTLPNVDEADPPISQVEDLWLLGPHRVSCSDATEASSFDRILGGDRAQMVFADPPYNVRIDGHVSGLGKAKHAEFAAASGEMTDAEFEAFLRASLCHTASHCANGAVAFVFMDWRHLAILDSARRDGFGEQLNLCVWTKTNAGMGSLYRSRHELIGVYKKGSTPHINNVKLGQYGRHRSNVWSYPGLNSFGRKRDERLAMHPTVKPVALVKDAILDCSRRGGIVLDPFLGSGTTLIAAERAGRRCCGLEIDPRYVDLILRRFRNMTGTEPVHAETGETFTDVARARAATAESAEARSSNRPRKGRRP